MKQYDIEVYETVDGKAPFGEWFLNLKDETAQAKFMHVLEGLPLVTLAIGRTSKVQKESLKCVNTMALAIAYFILL